MSAPLLVELLCEELPPKALKRLGDAFADGVFKGLLKREMLVGQGPPRAFATPRRLAVEIPGVKAASDSRATEVKLMPAAVGLDKDGKPTAALTKKLEAAGLAGLAPSKLRMRVDGKAEMLFADAMTPAVPLASALQAALDEAIAGLPIPKVMSYQLADGETTVQFVRPAHRLVALHGKDVVAVKALGLAADRITAGHRFLGPRELRLDSADAYATVLERDGKVIADFDARRKRITELLGKAAAPLTTGFIPPEALLDEVTALVEWPAVYVGRFEDEFLSVPAECLMLTMQQNQKYFPLLKDGKLLPSFLIVSNMEIADPANIVQGNERVVRPRLADARFFFETDKKVKLADRVAQLGSIVYHNKLGTQLERVDRLCKLADAIQKSLPRGEVGRAYAVRAARLAKADLVTLMVGEFPELQGVMGKYYAEADGEEKSVARAIEQHYWPRFAGDQLPTGDASIAVALADRLDSLVGMFSIGIVPTGDKDPLGLRRAALGVIRILMESKPALAMDLSALVASAAEGFGRKADAALAGSVNAFIRERLANLLRERGYSAQEVSAVLEVESDESKPNRLDLVPAKLEAVREFGKLPESVSLTAANKRISNILKQAKQKGEAYALLHEPFGDKLERELSTALFDAARKASPEFEKGNYTGYLKSFAVLKAPVDAFFEGVMVMADDPELRRKRLSLLYSLQFEMNRVADIAKLAA